MRLHVRYPGSQTDIVSPFRATDQGSPVSDAARWALTLAAGRDPGRLYMSELPGGVTWVHSRRQGMRSGVYVFAGDDGTPS